MYAKYYLEPGFLATTRKDISDKEWYFLTKKITELIPWLFLHLLGTQYFKRFEESRVTIFHASLSIICLVQSFGIHSVIILMVQPVVFFIIAEITQSYIVIWSVASGIIVFLIESIMFEDSNSNYIIPLAMCWINSRCVSFCLDHIWKNVSMEAGETKLWKFVKMIAFCLYLPNCINGPLITYEDYYRGVSNRFCSM